MVQHKPFVCPVCGTSKIESEQEYVARSPMFSGKKLVKCFSCGTKSMFPPEVEESYYITDYWTKENIERRTGGQYAQALARYMFAEEFISARKNLNVLDVGAGLGFFAKVLNDKYTGIFSYDAVEINPAAVGYLLTHIDSGHVLSDLPGGEVKYDMILLFHILEHIAEPAGFLAKVSDLLKPDGCLLVELPNEDWRYKKFNQPHVVYYNTKTLSMLLDRHGYAVSKVKECGSKVSGMANELRLASGVAGFADKLRALYYTIEKRLIPIENVYDLYGSDRQWIRLLARKKQKAL
ncbi:MAG: hypothetical protein A2283_10475 [Lentisphaerae bacterium RIFOXYA12_FULL_48_11]|nr:MAG: hypothetical protein A2283_10475 [Lentisphaerae bacterium RIFOXYA12_FULL_48_11]